MANKETKEIRDRLDNKARKEYVVPPDPKAFRARMALPERKDPKEPKVTPDILVFRVFQAPRDLKAPPDLKDQLVPPDRKVLPVPRDPVVSPVPMAPSDLPDPPV